jgi:hypothetical protein
MAKIGLRNKVAFQLDAAKFQRFTRDNSSVQKAYQAVFRNLTKALDQAITIAGNNPEEGLIIAKLCTRFVLEAMPDPVQDGGRATALSQFRMLENCLKEVRRPEEYLANMQEQFGPNLDPRKYTSGHDAFRSIIKSQRQKLYAEGQGFNSQSERNFCTKRSELLAAVERGYDRLREQALGVCAPDRKKGLGR